jgi:hypothetical protein
MLSPFFGEGVVSVTDNSSFSEFVGSRMVGKSNNADFPIQSRLENNASESNLGMRGECEPPTFEFSNG